MSTPTPCRSCGDPILFIKTPSGKQIPVNAERLAVLVDPDSSEKIVLSSGRVVSATTVDPRVTDGSLVGYRAHFATCPAASAWRKPRSTSP
jgi:hypothetical protein